MLCCLYEEHSGNKNKKTAENHSNNKNKLASLNRKSRFLRNRTLLTLISQSGDTQPGGAAVGQ